MKNATRSALKIISLAFAALLFTAWTSSAYEKDGSVVTRKSVGGGVAVAEPTTPPPSERKAGGGSPVKQPVKENAQSSAYARSGAAGGGEALAPVGNSPLGYTSGGGVQSPGGEKTCHVRGFKDPTGLIIEDHYQKCGTIVNGVTSTCYADGRCRLSY